MLDILLVLTYNHGLCGSLLYKPLALGIGNGKFRPHTSRKPSTDFGET